MRPVTGPAFHLHGVRVCSHDLDGGSVLALDRLKIPHELPVYRVTADGLTLWEGYGQMRAHGAFLNARRALGD